ncbi:helix-turn-helix domain-containing protein [Dysosmobacter sp.]|uniref:helix-turn-helix domain-containing protein n=1 Tax=Dysosmobacter sp. TaxID=2591382 RepID=UPI003D93D9A8
MEIRRLRTQANLTQMEVATAMQVDRSTVSYWERGIAMPRAEQLPKLADLFGCTIDALFGRESKDTA